METCHSSSWASSLASPLKEGLMPTESLLAHSVEAEDSHHYSSDNVCDSDATNEASHDAMALLKCQEALPISNMDTSSGTQ